jgi:hypothetical protein
LPFEGNYFCISIGFITVLVISLILYIFDFDNKKSYQPVKGLMVLAFIGTSLYYFVNYEKVDGYKNNNLPMVRNYGFVFGVLAYSSIQSVQTPFFIEGSSSDESFKYPLFFALIFVCI